MKLEINLTIRANRTFCGDLCPFFEWDFNTTIAHCRCRLFGEVEHDNFDRYKRNKACVEATDEG